MSKILSRWFLESFHFQEEKTRYLKETFESGSHFFFFFVKSAINIPAEVHYYCQKYTKSQKLQHVHGNNAENHTRGLKASDTNLTALTGPGNWVNFDHQFSSRQGLARPGRRDSPTLPLLSLQCRYLCGGNCRSVRQSGFFIFFTIHFTSKASLY